MSDARPVPREPTVYDISMTTIERKMLFNKGKKYNDKVNQAVGFILAVYAAKYNIDVHVFCLMTDHFHLVATDNEGHITQFTQDFKAQVARCIARLYGHRHQFFSSEQDRYEVLDLHEAARKTGYIIINPTWHMQVEDPDEWPGLRTSLEMVKQVLAGEEVSLTFQRPEWFYRKKGPMPETATLTLKALPQSQKAPDYVLERIEAEMASRRDKVEAEMKRKKQWYSGLDNVRAARWTDRAKSPRPAGPQRKTLVTGSDRDEVKAREREYRRWVNAYNTSRLTLMKEGEGEFPAETNQLRKSPGVTLGPKGLSPRSWAVP